MTPRSTGLSDLSWAGHAISPSEAERWGPPSSEKTLHLKSAGPQAQGHITPSDPPGTRPSQHPRGLQKPLRQLTGSEGTFSGSRGLATPPPTGWPRIGAESRAGCSGPTSSAPEELLLLAEASLQSQGHRVQPVGTWTRCPPNSARTTAAGQSQAHPGPGPWGQKARGCHTPAPGEQPQVPSPILQTESVPVKRQCRVSALSSLPPSQTPEFTPELKAPRPAGHGGPPGR